MFKKINLQSSVCKDKFVLMKNSREQFCEIQKEYIKNIHYSWHDINDMDIEIPYHISVNGKKQVNPLYDKFLGKRQYIIVNENEKYVITDCEKTEDYTGKKIKKIKAQSSEITLNDFDFYIGEGGMTRKLYRVANDIDISEGILDLCLAETGWSVGDISDKARLEFNKMNEIYHKDLYNSLQKNNVVKETVLWEKTFTDLKPILNNVLSVNISYKNIKSYIGGKLQKDENSIHQLGEFHTSITKIKAIYSGNDESRYAIKYEITLADGLTVEKWCDFTYLGAMDVNFETISMSYTTGYEVEKSYIKYRSFDEGMYKVYDFLKQEVEKAFGVKLIFDTTNKEILCYHFTEVGHDTPLFLSYENFITTINKKEQYDEVISKLYVESQKATISEENPTGLNYILDYTYFREHGLMSDELISAYDRYIAVIDGKQDIIVNKRIDLNTWNKKKIKLDTERKTLEENIKGLQSIWSAYIKEKDEINASRIASEINGLHNKHADNLRETEICRQNINNLNEEIKTIVDSISIPTATDVQGKIFDGALLDELNDITITDTLTDDYYTTSYSLYSYAVDVLSKRNKLPIEFTTDTVGLIQNMIIPEGHTFDDILTLGNYVNIDDTEINNEKIRLIEFNYSPSDFKIDGLKFSNNDEDFTDLSRLSNVGRSINKNINYTNNYKTSWVEGKNVNNFVNSMLTDYLDTKAVNIRGRQGRNKYDQSEAGQFIIDALSDNEASQIYIGSGMICFTSDSWLTTDTCLDGSGLVAQALIGKIVASNKLLIGNENNTMIIDENAITIEGNCLNIKGIDGTKSNFNSYIKMLSDQISLGVSDSINHTDAQFKILSEGIATKVSKGDEFKTEFKQTSEAFNFNVGNNTMNVFMNKYGLSIRNGAITIYDNVGNIMLQGDAQGNLTFKGRLQPYDSIIRLFGENCRIDGSAGAIRMQYNPYNYVSVDNDYTRFFNKYSDGGYKFASLGINEERHLCFFNERAMLKLLGGSTASAVIQARYAGDTGYGAFAAAEFITMSSEKFKTEIQEPTDINFLDMLKNNNIKKYKLKAEVEKLMSMPTAVDENGQGMESKASSKLGFILEELTEEARRYLNPNGSDGIDTYSMCSILWNVVQKQQERLDILEQNILTQNVGI